MRAKDVHVSPWLTVCRLAGSGRRAPHAPEPADKAGGGAVLRELGDGSRLPGDTGLLLPQWMWGKSVWDTGRPSGPLHCCHALWLRSMETTSTQSRQDEQREGSVTPPGDRGRSRGL